MRFYNRNNELLELQKLWKQSEREGKLAVVTGRRRVGKTLLVTEFTKDLPHFYFFIEKKPESLLCADFLAAIKDQIPFPVVGEVKSFKDLFLILLEYAKTKRIVVIIDEFQEFYQINQAVYSELQNLWDQYRRQVKMFLLTVGSIYSLMHKIFEDQKEPLFGRADRIIKLHAFSILTLANLLKEHDISGVEKLFDFYVLTGAVPKYLDMLITNQVGSKNEILNFMLQEFSPFLDEGKNVLIEEFGKEYGIYFAILELISRGKTSRPEIESLLEKNVGGYLEKLEKTYHIIDRVLPLGAKPGSRLIKYAMKDPFLNFWFRFFYRNRSAIELKNFDYIRRMIDRDYSHYCGRFLERFFIELINHQKKYNQIGTYWETKNLNEIDLVAVNNLDKELLIADIKLNPKKLNIAELRFKAQNLLKEYPDYHVEWVGLSLQDAIRYLSL